MSEEQARNETFIRFEDAVEQLGIKSWELVYRMREAGLLCRLNFPQDSRYDWQAEVFWVKTRHETVFHGEYDKQGDPILKRDEKGEPLLLESRESVRESLQIPGRAAITLKGMAHLAESLREGLLGFDLLPGLEIIPEGQQETLEHVVWRVFGDEPPWTLASPDHSGIITIERLLKPTEQERETGVKPPKLEILQTDFQKVLGQSQKGTETKKPERTYRQRNSHPEVPQVFWRAFCALKKDLQGVAPEYKTVWSAVYNEWDQIRENKDVFAHPTYDKREIITDIDPIGTPNAHLAWLVKADNVKGTYHLISLSSLLTGLKKKPPF